MEKETELAFYKLPAIWSRSFLDARKCNLEGKPYPLESRAAFNRCEGALSFRTAVLKELSRLKKLYGKNEDTYSMVAVDVMDAVIDKLSKLEP